MVSSSERVQVEVFPDRVAMLTINRPPVNAISPELRGEIAGKLKEVEDDEKIWTLVIIGAGDKFFAAGADIPTLLALEKESGLKRVQDSRKFFSGLSHMEKPVIAAINGVCLGGGLELALACDIRVAAEHAKLGLPEVGLGIIPGAGGTQLLPRLVGPGWANFLIFSGEAISANKAREIGLVQEVVRFDSLRDTVLRIASAISSRGPVAVRAAKRVIRAGLDQPIEKGLDLENEAFAEVCGTQDKNEGINSFLEKRKPQFQGR